MEKPKVTIGRGAECHKPSPGVKVATVLLSRWP
jgi:hypothetical protein